MNPSRTDRRRRHLLRAAAALPLAGLPWRAPAQAPALPAPPVDAPFEIPAAAARADLALLRRAFEQLHPGLYRYATPGQIAAGFDIAETAVAQGTDRARLFLLVTRLAAEVRCGHTWTNTGNQTAVVRRQLFERADKLPLTLRLVQGRFLITAAGGPGLAGLPNGGRGSELLAIDGRTPAQVVELLMPYLRADGASDGHRLAQIDSAAPGAWSPGEIDRLLPLLMPPTNGRWRLAIRAADSGDAAEAAVPAVSLAERATLLGAKPEPNDWRFEIQRDVGVLTLPTFAFWNSRFDGRAFLEQTFAELREKAVPYLVIDLRRNEGGDDALGRALLAQLIKAPYTPPAVRLESCYEQAPADLLAHAGTWDRGFFDRRGRVVRESDRDGRPVWRLPDAAPAALEPVAKPYAGRTLMLVGPRNSSAGFLLARDAKASGAATLLGRTTGGNRRGLNGGQICWLVLPASGIAVDVPLVASHVQEPGGEPPDAGVQPDVPVPPLFGVEAGGADGEFVAALRQIARWRAEARRPA